MKIKNTPYGFGIYKDNQLIEFHPNKKITINNPFSMSYSAPLSLHGDYSLEDLKHNTNWIGIDSDRFKPYRHWINRGGTCGMMSSAVLLAYYQDYIDESIIPSSLRQKGSTNFNPLYKELMKNITSFNITGTNATDVSMGINRFLRRQKTNQNYQAKSTMLTTYGIVKTKLEALVPTPTIVGITPFFDSPKAYKRHWVVAYRALQIGNEKFYQVHDNHGRHDAIINVRWTLTAVRLIKK